MRKTKTNKPHLQIVKPFYTITDLSKILRMSREGARKFVYRSNIPCHLIGNRIICYLSDIRSYQPVLFASILEANQLNDLINLRRETSNETYTKNQFVGADY